MSLSESSGSLASGWSPGERRYVAIYRSANQKKIFQILQSLSRRPLADQKGLGLWVRDCKFRGVSPDGQPLAKEREDSEPLINALSTCLFDQFLARVCGCNP